MKLSSGAVKLALSTLRPDRFAGELARIAGKAARRLRRPEERVVTLEPDLPAAEVRGDVLFSFILDPFLVSDEAVSHDHTHDWESLEMARAFLAEGYRVDAIHWTHTGFTPAKDYAALVDPRINLERLAPPRGPLGEGCLKIMHIETAHPSWHNAAQLRRLAALERRRGVAIAPQKLIEENRAIEHADCATILGNAFTASTYAFAGKPIYRIPISVPYRYPFPEDKDFAAASRSFLWFGSGGLVHKGLDLVLEAFAGLPDHRLTVCGPIRRERDFAAHYYRELYQTPNIRTLGWVDVAGPRFHQLGRECLGLVYPSCSEGGGGSVLQCMHLGLVPLVTPEASVDLAPDYGVELAEPTVEGVRRAVVELSARPPAELARMSRRAWEHARAHHTRERFAERYRAVIAVLLERHRRGLAPPSAEEMDELVGVGDGAGGGAAGEVAP